MKITASILLALLALTSALASDLQVDVCNVSTGSVTRLTLPAHSLVGSFSAMPPGRKVLADPRLYAQARAMFARRSPDIDRPLSSAATKAGAPPAILGTYHALVLLVDFTDHPAEVYPGMQAVKHYDDMLFSLGQYSTGSMRDWYKENSYGKFEVDGMASGGPTGWYRAPQPYTYYVNGNYGTGYYPNNAQRLVQELVVQADPLVDFSLYDNDHDGQVESLFVVHAGPGAESTGDPDDIWSHKWGLEGLPEGGAPLVDGVTASSYSIEPENGKIGVFCHEYGHLLGAYDLYDYGNDAAGYDSAGLGVWSVMAGGSWGGDYDSDDRPVHFDPYHKILFGWIKPTVLAAARNGVSLPDVEHHPVVYKLWKNGKPGKEYFLVENRQQLGFDARLYGSGLLVHHVDEAKFESTVNDEEWFPGLTSARHYAVGLLQADARWDLEHNFNVGDAGDPFPGAANNRALSFSTSPDSNSYLAGPTGVQITRISDSMVTMTADLALLMPERATWYVRADAVGNGSGATPDTAFATLAQALAVADDDDTIVVAPGVYTASIDFAGRRLLLTGTKPSDPATVAATIIRGTDKHPTVRFASAEQGEAVLRGLTITHLPGAAGNGVYLSGASPRIEDCVIRNNVVDRGGDLLSYGGGVYVRGKANPVILRTTFADNSGDYGAGLYVLGASATLRDCAFLRNRATYEGGGVYLKACLRRVSLENCTFVGDEAKRGGGLFCDSSSPLVARCRFTGCVARNDGGGIYLRDRSSARINRTVLYQCRAFLYSDSGGGGIFCTDASPAQIDRVTIYGCSSPAGAGLCALDQSKPTLTSSIIADCDGPGVQADGPLVVTYCDVWRNRGGNFKGFGSPLGTHGNLSVRPQFANALAGDFHLKSRAGRWTSGGWVRDAVDSPCLDAGDPAAALGAEPQPNGGRLNMGSDGGTSEASRSSATALLSSISPTAGATGVARNTTVMVTFRVPMKEASVQSRFHLVGQALQPGGPLQQVAGSFSWPQPGVALTFTPSQPLTAGRAYTATIAPGAIRQDGTTVSWTETFSFATGNGAAVLSAAPRGQAVYIDTPLTVAFDQPMDAQSVQSAFRLSPARPGTIIWADSLHLVFRPSGLFAAGTTYTATLGGAARSAAGEELGADYTWQFTTLGGFSPGPVVAAAVAAPNGGAQITVSLSSAARVSVAITNLAGVTVAVLGDRSLPSGVSTLLWNGRGRFGAKLPGGQYLVRVQAEQAGGLVSGCLTGLRR